MRVLMMESGLLLFSNYLPAVIGCFWVRSLSERLRIKRMVEEKIRALSKDVEVGGVTGFTCFYK